MQFGSGAESKLYAVLTEPFVDPEYSSPMNDTVFTMTLDLEIVNLNIDPVDVTFPDTCGFKPGVETKFLVRIHVDFIGMYIGGCGADMTTISYPQGYTNKSTQVHLIFFDLKITKLLEGLFAVT